MIAFLIVSFIASVVGAICGIGGGVIIKPCLDMLQLADVSSVSFLSGCTVLSMSCYSIGKMVLSGEKAIDMKSKTPLAVGAAVGGVFGKQMFSAIKLCFVHEDAVTAVQSLCLAIITIGTLLYTLNKRKIRTHYLKSAAVCVMIGFLLGMSSSFLGIGGGPVNLVVLYFFFSMDTKTAASNSLYIILFSQIASLFTTIFTRSVPAFEWPVLIFMVTGGIGGGIVGRAFNRRMKNAAVDRLFIGLMIAIICISLYNAL